MNTSWVWLGDHLAVDFANTVKVVDGRTVELIGTREEFNSWYELVPAPLPHIDIRDSELVSLRTLRDVALRLLHAAAAGEALDTEDVSSINRTVRASSIRRVLGATVGSTRLEAGDDFPALAGVLASAVVDLLAQPNIANLAVCPAPDCGQFFHRARPNQRWCSPGCGNRARVDRHRHRRNSPSEDGR